MTESIAQGGRVNRLKATYGFPESISHEELGVMNDPAKTFAHAEQMAKTLALAGINLIHRIRLTLPSKTTFCFMKLRVWTDPHFRVLEYSTPDVLEVDLRHLAQLGIGTDATKWYFALPKRKGVDPLPTPAKPPTPK